MKQGKGTSADPILAAGAVIWRKGAEGPEFLLLQNADHHSWGFAKGHLMEGESLSTGACREILEETGLSITPADFTEGFADASLYQTKPSFWKRTVLFLVEADLGFEVQISAEHDQAIWAGLSQALALMEHDKLRRTLHRAAYVVVV